MTRPRSLLAKTFWIATSTSETALLLRERISFVNTGVVIGCRQQTAFSADGKSLPTGWLHAKHLPFLFGTARPESRPIRLPFSQTGVFCHLRCPEGTLCRAGAQATHSPLGGLPDQKPDAMQPWLCERYFPIGEFLDLGMRISNLPGLLFLPLSHVHAVEVGSFQGSVD